MPHLNRRQFAAWMVMGAGPAAALPALAQTVPLLTADEESWLKFMREEEKLARDVYRALYEKWTIRVFDNISRSEARHFAAVGTLVNRYGVSDTAAGLDPGVYSNPELTALHADLLQKGMQSLKDALEVGVLIEKHDISDLETAISRTDKSDIKTVYANLLAGSLNHLESFENLLEIML